MFSKFLKLNKSLKNAIIIYVTIKNNINILNAYSY